MYNVHLPILYDIELPPFSLIIVQYKHNNQKYLKTFKTILERTIWSEHIKNRKELVPTWLLVLTSPVLFAKSFCVFLVDLITENTRQ